MSTVASIMDIVRILDSAAVRRKSILKALYIDMEMLMRSRILKSALDLFWPDIQRSRQTNVVQWMIPELDRVRPPALVGTASIDRVPRLITGILFMAPNDFDRSSYCFRVTC